MRDIKISNFMFFYLLPRRCSASKRWRSSSYLDSRLHTSGMRCIFRCRWSLWNLSAVTVALTKAFTLVSRSVDEDFGGDNVAKREEHLHELAVTELLRQVVDEQVAALGSWDRASYHINQSTSKHLNLKYNTQVRMLVLDEFCSSQI